MGLVFSFLKNTSINEFLLGITAHSVMQVFLLKFCANICDFFLSFFFFNIIFKGTESCFTTFYEMLAQFQTQLRFSDEIIQAAIKTGCLRKAFFLALSPHKKRLSFY